MALQFGKRDNEQARPLGSGMASPRPTPGAYGSTAPSTSSPEPQTPAASQPAASTATATPEGGSKLIVGPNIKLKGVEIQDCDTLFVEGTVEATMDSRVIQIAQQGAFKGSAEVDVAEVHGTIDGNLTVRQKLVIHATGKVTGRIRYGKVVIEEGGQLSGDVECAAAATGKATQAAGSKPSMALAA
ncbi:MAG: polymer-forming cytoskeletal protein [Hydrogenophaga sp.]|uniref:Polymer-forming cytoskeletal protein n=1 Tax=Hydrogenophaga crocea TaxID=2716225 RepID=A0A6G8IFC7_9BURK|nr:MULTISPECIES: polymer-forming cytoskeletal protein [Hydrogenophaga]MBL0946485.1 polymer-forming cytoskeletal protein [Hydrogenophaga sp.]QIM51897.1 polymer-forming cytoskeletal protein [Hydrogenophaga crocea]